jgi:hypothetical protein
VITMKKKLWQPDQPMQPIHNCTYMLRLWRVDQSNATDWRASLEIPETGKRIGFASLEQLFAYLIEVVESKADVSQTGDRGKENCNG